MNCREFTSFLDAFVAGTLSDGERFAFDHHIGVCPDCQNYLGKYRTTLGLTRSLREQVELPADVPHDLVTAILDARRRE